MLEEAQQGDRIVLEGMVFYGFHGAREAERQLGQRFIVDLEVSLDLEPAGKSDDLAQTVDYAALYRLVAAVVTGPPKNLIEAVAEEIAARVLSQFDVESVRVRVRKPEAPLPGVLASACVQIARRHGKQ